MSEPAPRSFLEIVIPSYRGDSLATCSSSILERADFIPNHISQASLLLAIHVPGLSRNKIEGRHEPGEVSYVRSALWVRENRPNRPRMAKAGYSRPILWAGADDVWDRS